ncbi:AIR carboxylase family protein [Candidatus Peregrinibacteria bacterium]|jgi:5-(carboxyamino)imidazole ribonucleotide mutase|nr:AIR carboxylase family protein [Candidatus Peregrinibacteria bacterium]
MKIVILAGSETDKWLTDKIESAASGLNIETMAHFASAHKKTREVLDVIESYANEKVVFITVAGRSNALSGVTAANCNQPVIACPPFKDKADFMVNINSTLQMPSGTPVLTILEPSNAVLAAKRILEI